MLFPARVLHFDLLNMQINSRYCSRIFVRVGHIAAQVVSCPTCTKILNGIYLMSKHCGHTEIGELQNVSVSQQEIFWLYISVGHATVMQVILKKTASITVVLFPFLGFFQKQMVILGFHTGGFIMKVTKIQKVFSQPEYSMYVELFHFFCQVFNVFLYRRVKFIITHTTKVYIGKHFKDQSKVNFHS